MDSPEVYSRDMAENDEELSVGLGATGDAIRGAHDRSWLSEIADQLDNDPQECWQALESLVSLEPEIRLSIIEELSVLGTRPGAQTLLRLLSSAHDAPTRAAAQSALARTAGAADGSVGIAISAARTIETAGPAAVRTDVVAVRPLSLSVAADRTSPRLARCLVTSVDGLGRGTIVVSTVRAQQRRTAAFLCDVRQGICDVVGNVEPDSADAGGLVDELDQDAGSVCARDQPELALGLLAGSLLLCGPNVTEPVRHWLLGTLGPHFEPASFPAAIPGLDVSTIPQSEMPERAIDVLEACPSWLDLSPLTFELAEEIWLREGQISSDPDRDSGAYRFLFEHRLIHRLELYRRMLLWMAWLWKFADEIELSRSALALADQLADEQFAVPSHPFTVELTTRSLKAAQGRLGSSSDPRCDPGRLRRGQPQKQNRGHVEPL